MGADALVLDASAALSLVRAEPSHGLVARAIGRAGSRPLLVPEVFWVETVNALVRRHGLAMDAALGAIAELDGLGLRTIQLGRGGLLDSVALMLEHRLTAYDASYLALAHAVNADLLTLDRQLAEAAGDRAVPLDPNEIRESRGPYRLEPWITWEEAPAYLAAAREAARPAP